LRVESLRDLIEIFDRELAMVERHLHRELKDHHGYGAIQAVYGVGPITAAIFVAEIGDVTRFPTARHLCSWAGMTPKLRESDTKFYKGRITKQGSTIVRWAALESVVRYHGGAAIAPAYRRAMGEPHRPGRGGQKTAHPGLLRVARRRDPQPE
jgi:transposase